MASQSASLTTFTLCFLGILQFGARAGPATTRSVLAETDPDTLAPSRSAMALASLRVICSRLPVKTTVLPAKALAVPGALHRLGADLLQKLPHGRGVVRLGEELDQRVGRHGADFAIVGEGAVGIPGRWPAARSRAARAASSRSP